MVGIENSGEIGEQAERSPEAVLVVSSSLGQRREETWCRFGDARWGYSYNQPSRGIVVMVTTATTTRSGLGGVFKDIFAFAASLLPSPSPYHSLFLFLSSVSSCFCIFFFPFYFAFPVSNDCFSSRDL